MPELKQEGFERFLARLDAERERAGRRYEELRLRLIFYFERRGCRTQAECADETINRVCARLANGEEIAQLASYCFGVARRVLQEYWDDPRREWAELDEAAPVPETTTDPRAVEREREAEQNGERLRACMRECFARLPAAECALITGYCTADDREELARQHAITINALRIRINRIREKLRACVAVCLKKTSRAAEMKFAPGQY